MLSNYYEIVIVYIVAISVMAAILTILDKWKAKHNKWRIPENTLMIVGLLGGALAMYITMKTIRHKTLHKKFMWGLPLEILFHCILVLLVIFVL